MTPLEEKLSGEIKVFLLQRGINWHLSRLKNTQKEQQPLFSTVRVERSDCAARPAEPISGNLKEFKRSAALEDFWMNDQ